MAVTIIDDFNSYSNGNLNGQGGWSGDTSYQVQGSTVWEGAKAVANNNGTNDIVISKSIGPYTNGIISVYMRREWSGIFNFTYSLFDGATNKVDFYMVSDFTTSDTLLTKSGGNVTVGTNTVSTWYQCDIEIDGTNQRFRGRLNGGAWSSWLSQTFTSISSIRLGKASNGNTGNALYDYITYESPSVVFTISETLALTESISNLRNRLFSTSETVTLTETISILKGIAFSIAEALGLVETFTSTRTRLFTVAESMGLVELAVSFRLKWNAITKSATATMNNVSKSVSNWINTTKN